MDPSGKEGKTGGLPETRRVPDPTRRPRIMEGRERVGRMEARSRDEHWGEPVCASWLGTLRTAAALLPGASRFLLGQQVSLGMPFSR